MTILDPNESVRSNSNENSSFAKDDNESTKECESGGSHLSCRGTCDGQPMTMFEHPRIGGGCGSKLKDFCDDISRSVKTSTQWQREDMAQELASMIWKWSSDAVQDKHVVCNCATDEGIRAYFIGSAIRMRRFGGLDCTKSFSGYESRKVSLDDEDSEFQLVDEFESFVHPESELFGEEEETSFDRLIALVRGDVANESARVMLDKFLSFLNDGKREHFLAILSGATQEQIAMRRNVQSDSVRKTGDRLEADIETFLRKIKFAQSH